MDTIDFHYAPTCSAPGCGRPASYKVAAVWTSGASWELKNYGLACDEHRVSQLIRGGLRRGDLVLGDGEVVGDVGLYLLEPGRHDIALSRLPDHDNDHA